MILEKFNPMAFIIDGCRKSLIYGQMPDLKVLLICLAIGALFIFVFVRFIYKNENSYVKVS